MWRVDDKEWKNQNSKEQYEKLDKVHYQIENELIQLIKSMQKKIKDTSWNEALLGK